ncbi:MAG: fasciclin domain-containing protein [Anaerolineales bacterium]|nr:fasciclin domain-containing protein [Anaerolineales bacterium]
MYNKLYSKEVWKYLFFWLLFLVACGGTPEVIPTPVPSPVPTDTPVPAATPVPTKVPEPTATLAATATLGVVPTATQNLPSVAQILADNGRFSTFKTAFEQANLDEALGDPGPFTLFVPTNDAFAKLPSGLFDAFRADPKGDLSDLVLGHVVNDNLAMTALTALTAVTTAKGDRISLQKNSDGTLLLNGSVAVVGEPLLAWNGIVYVVDTVLLPDIADLLLLLPQFTLLTEALDAAGMMPQLHESGPFTLFAPTDAALTALPQELRQQLLQAADTAASNGFLRNHLVGQQLLQPTLAAAGTVPTLGDSEIVVTLNDGFVHLNDTAQLTNIVLPAANGTIFGIDGLLTMPTTLASDS